MFQLKHQIRVLVLLFVLILVAWLLMRGVLLQEAVWAEECIKVIVTAFITLTTSDRIAKRWDDLERETVAADAAATAANTAATATNTAISAAADIAASDESKVEAPPKTDPPVR